MSKVTFPTFNDINRIAVVSGFSTIEKTKKMLKEQSDCYRVYHNEDNLYGDLNRYMDSFSEDDKLVIINPENDMHPKQQIGFGEILVIIVNECNCKVLVLTNSTYILRSIEDHTSNPGDPKCEYYLSHQDDEHDVEYLDRYPMKIYGTFGEPFSQLELVEGI